MIAYQPVACPFPNAQCFGCVRRRAHELTCDPKLGAHVGIDRVTPAGVRHEQTQYYVATDFSGAWPFATSHYTSYEENDFLTNVSHHPVSPDPDTSAIAENFPK